jgi:hypothetical protein
VGYIELRDTRYKFIATYKERLDSLLSYQKKLNDILGSSKKEETKIKAMTALQSIELDVLRATALYAASFVRWYETVFYQSRITNFQIVTLR